MEQQDGDREQRSLNGKHVVYAHARGKAMEPLNVPPLEVTLLEFIRYLPKTIEGATSGAVMTTTAGATG